MLPTTSSDHTRPHLPAQPPLLIIQPPLSCCQSTLALSGENCFSPSSQAEVPTDRKNPDTVMLRAWCCEILWELKSFKERGLSFTKTKKIIGLVTTVRREVSTSTKHECSCKQILQVSVTYSAVQSVYLKFHNLPFRFNYREYFKLCFYGSETSLHA